MRDLHTIHRELHHPWRRSIEGRIWDDIREANRMLAEASEEVGRMWRGGLEMFTEELRQKRSDS